jgi:uncharacterized protein (DUF302 family)
MKSAGISRTLKGTTMDQAYQRVTDALKTEGFGVLTEVNIAETLKKKIDVDFRPYRILGACNPKLAHKALTFNPQAGLMMPCNVILYTEGADVVVTAVDPTQMPVAHANDDIAKVAEEVRVKLDRVVQKA